MDADDTVSQEIRQAQARDGRRLAALAALHLPPVLRARVSVEDVVQQTFLNALKRPEFFRDRPEVPVFAKLRIILMQTIQDLERDNLGCQKRDAGREVPFDAEEDDADRTQVQCRWDCLADTITSPRSQLAKAERGALIRRVLADLGPADRGILEMRHFEQLSNAECAGVLGVSPDAASIRYVRALQKMRLLLAAYSEFRT